MEVIVRIIIIQNSRSAFEAGTFVMNFNSLLFALLLDELNKISSTELVRWWRLARIKIMRFIPLCG